MKIGMIVNNLEVSGGYQKLVIRLSQQLEKKGNKVIIYSPRVDKENCYPGEIKKLKIETLSTQEASATPVEVYKALVPKISDDIKALIIHDELSLIAIGLMKKRPSKIVWMLNNQLPADLMRYLPEMK